MKTPAAIGASLLLAAFALVGTWAGHVSQSNAALPGLSKATSADILQGKTPQCPYEDQSNGFGGQSGSCTFTCQAPGLITLTVQADDEDAGVSGSGSCGDGSLHCSGEHSCGDQARITAGGAGTCSGDSDEFWDSGLYVSCAGEASKVDPTEVPQTPKVCVVHDPDLICIDPGERSSSSALDVCRVASTRTGATVCQAGVEAEHLASLRQNVTAFVASHVRIASPGVSVHVFGVAQVATALVCWDHQCLQRMPQCEPLEGNRTVRCTAA